MYNKLFTKILDSSVWLQPDATRIVWVTLIAAMDETGFVQAAAVGNLAGRARVSIPDCRTAVATLEGPDPESSDPEHEGRRIERVPGGWVVLNAEKYRALVTRAVNQARTRERVAKHRAVKHIGNDVKRSCNDLVTPSEADTEVQAEVHTEVHTQSVPAVRLTPIIARRRKDAAFEAERVYVPQRLHQDFLALGRTDDELWRWYARTADEWAGPRRADEPGADMFTFWRDRYAEQWPRTGKAKPDTRPQWVRDVEARKDAQEAL